MAYSTDDYPIEIKMRKPNRAWKHYTYCADFAEVQFELEVAEQYDFANEEVFEYSLWDRESGERIAC